MKDLLKEIDKIEIEINSNADFIDENYIKGCLDTIKEVKEVLSSDLK